MEICREKDERLHWIEVLKNDLTSRSVDFNDAISQATKELTDADSITDITLCTLARIVAEEDNDRKPDHASDVIGEIDGTCTVYAIWNHQGFHCRIDWNFEKPEADEDGDCPYDWEEPDTWPYDWEHLSFFCLYQDDPLFTFIEASSGSDIHSDS